MRAPARGPLAESGRAQAREALLLHAALGDGAGAVDAWRRWRGGAGVEPVEAGSLRLLSAAYVNLKRLGVERGELSRMRGVRRQQWYRDGLLLWRLQLLVRQADGRGIPAMVSHGAAIALLPGAAAGMGEAAMAVRRADAPAAAGLLDELGWRPVRPPRYGFTPAYLQAEHACVFADGGGLRCVLHWSLFDRRIDPNDESEIFAGAVRAEIAGVPVRAMSATDLLLLAGSGSAELWGEPEPSWVLDAATILRGSAIDWRRLIEVGGRLGVLAPLGVRLRYLRTWCPTAIPSDVLARVDAAPVSRAERLFRAAHLRPGIAAAYRMLRHWRRYRLVRGTPAYAGPAGFAIYLKEAFDLDGAWGVPAHLARGLRRLLPAP